MTICQPVPRKNDYIRVFANGVMVTASITESRINNDILCG
jgi:hypothetical protein